MICWITNGKRQPAEHGQQRRCRAAEQRGQGGPGERQQPAQGSDGGFGRGAPDAGSVMSSSGALDFVAVELIVMALARLRPGPTVSTGFSPAHSTRIRPRRRCAVVARSGLVSAAYDPNVLDSGMASEIAGRFVLGAEPVLSARPVARGKQGQVWRLDTAAGRWAVKEPLWPTAEAQVSKAAAFQEAAAAERSAALRWSSGPTPVRCSPTSADPGEGLQLGRSIDARHHAGSGRRRRDRCRRPPGPDAGLRAD